MKMTVKELIKLLLESHRPDDEVIMCADKDDGGFVFHIETVKEEVKSEKE